MIGKLARAQDRHDREGIIAAYHPDAIDDHVIFNGSATEFADWVIALLGERFEETTHFVGPPVIEIDGDVAQTNTQAVCHHLTRTDLVLEPGGRMPRADFVLGMRYLDRFERRGGVWKIAYRQSVLDWSYHAMFEGSIKSWHAAGMIEGRRDRTDPSYKPI